MFIVCHLLPCSTHGLKAQPGPFASLFRVIFVLVHMLKLNGSDFHYRESFDSHEIWSFWEIRFRDDLHLNLSWPSRNLGLLNAIIFSIHFNHSSSIFCYPEHLLRLFYLTASENSVHNMFQMLIKCVCWIILFKITEWVFIIFVCPLLLDYDIRGTHCHCCKLDKFSVFLTNFQYFWNGPAFDLSFSML